MATNVYAGNLSHSTTEDELRAAFEEYGEVASVKIITDRASGRSKGFGFVEMSFVEMSTEEEATAAINGLNGTELGGHTIKVDQRRSR
jgi:RNA recognition motif-containing protein